MSKFTLYDEEGVFVMEVLADNLEEAKLLLQVEDDIEVVELD